MIIEDDWLMVGEHKTDIRRVIKETVKESQVANDLIESMERQMVQPSLFQVRKLQPERESCCWLYIYNLTNMLENSRLYVSRWC